MSEVTGAKDNFSEVQLSYFKRVRDMKLNNPGLVGFGISNHDTFNKACKYTGGAIIGSAFVKMLGQEGHAGNSISKFVGRIRGYSHGE